MEEQYLEVNFITQKEEEADVLNINACLQLIDIETGEGKTIGNSLLYIFNEYRLDSWYELMDNADSISGDVLEVIDVLHKAKENEEIYGLITVIDHIEIDKCYRKKGCSSELLDKIIDYLEYINVNYIGLIPARIYD